MSCFNLLDQSAWPAQSHLTWIFIPASKYKTFFLDKVSSSWNRNLSLFPCHASSISLSYFVFNLPVYHSLSHTLCTSLAKKNKKTLDLQSPMGGSRNMFVWCHRGEMAANQRHLFLRSASIISTQHKPNLWTSGKTKCIFSSPENNTCSFLAFQQQYL